MSIYPNIQALGAPFRGSGGLFAASFVGFSATSGVIKGLVTGTGAFQIARATTGSAPDWEGLERDALVDEARVEYGRVVENIFDFSEDLQADSWTAANATINSAIEIEYDGTNGARMRRDFTTVTSQEFRPRSLIRKTAGTTSGTQVRLTVFGNGSSVDAFLGDLLDDNAWHLISTPSEFIATSDGTTTLQLRCDVAATFEVTQYQFEKVQGVDKNPSEYVSVGVLSDDYHGLGADGVKAFDYLKGNSVDVNNEITEAKGETLGSDVLGSDRDLTGWGTSLVTLGDTVTAYDGTTLTNNGLVMDNNEGIFEIDSTVSLTADVPYRYSFLAKAGAYEWVRAQIRTQPVNNYQFFHLSGAGALGATWGGSVKSSITALANGWYLCLMTVYETTTNASRGVRIQIAEADDDYNISTAGGSSGIYVDFPQVLIGLDDWRFLYESFATENVVHYSSQLDNAEWVQSGTDVDANAAVSPRGLTEADKLTEDSNVASIVHTLKPTLEADVVATDVRVFTAYVKPVENDWIKLVQFQNYANFNCAEGKVGNSSCNSTKMYALANGWYRVVMRYTVATGGLAARPYLALGENDTANWDDAYVGTDNDGVYVWRVQDEIAVVESSSIETGVASVSRTADDGSPSFAFSNWSQPKGTWYCDLWAFTVVANSIVTIQNSAAANVLHLTNTGAVSSDDGTTTVVTAAGAIDNDTRCQAVLDFSTADNERQMGGRNVFADWILSAIGAYDGDFPTASVFNVAYGATVPLRIRDLYGYTNRQGIPE